MNLNKLEQIIFKNSSNLNRIKGEELFKKKLVFNIKGKNIGNAYHIYGDIKDTVKIQKVHIKIDTTLQKLESVSCNCDEYKEISKHKKIFMCEHINGVAYEFLDKLYKKQKNEAQHKYIAEKNIIEIDVKIEYKEWNMNNCFELEFKSGTKFKNLISDLNRFIDDLNNDKYNLASKDNKLINFIQNELQKRENLKNSNRNILLNKDNLKSFLKTLGKRKVLFKYNGIEYKSIILNEDLPLHFTLKSDEKSLIVTTYKNIPIVLDNNEEVYFFQDNIYIPSENQYTKYKKFYKNFLKSNTVRYRKTEKNYKALVEILNSISDNVKISENLKTSNFSNENEQELRIFDSSSIFIDLYEENSELILDYDIEGLNENDIKEALERYRAKGKTYKIEGKGFIDFEDEGVKNFLNLLNLLNADGNSVKIDKNKESYLTGALNEDNLRINKSTELFENLKNKFENLSKLEKSLDENFKGELRSYQKEGFNWFKNLSEACFGGILADEMGLGKTIQTIAFLSSEVGKKTLIVTPTSLIYNWKSEFEKFAPHIKVDIFNKNEDIKESLDKNDVILITYGLMRNHISNLRNIEFEYCIIDEAQNIKNSIGKSANSVKQVNSKIRFALTGTPLENNLLELWSIFDFIMPGYLFSKKEFEKRFINDDEISILKTIIKPFILRRTKKEVVKELPDKIENKILVPMTSEQEIIYKSYINEVKDKIRKGKNNKIEMLSYLTRLRQICLDPGIIFEDYTGGSGKFKIVLELLDEKIENGGKVILFSQFTSVLKNIEEILRENFIDFLYLDGSIEAMERINLVNIFNNDDKIKVFLISLKAGGVGLNLTSANYVIHFDPWWNPAVEDQATDRAHRIGQENTVEVIKLIAKDTIEEKILLLQEEKKKLISEVLTDDLNNVNSLNKVDIEDIIEMINRVN